MADRQTTVEPVHDVLRAAARPLDALLQPSAVAVVGASDKPGSVGNTLAANLLAGRNRRSVYLVNSARATVLGETCYPRLTDVPEQIDLAVIAVPAPAVPDVIDDCLAAGVSGAIVISAGFREIGPEGVSLEARIRRQIQGRRLRLVGPNCLGVMSPVHGLNATFAADMASPGSIAFISQSGAMLTAILDWSVRENVGFSHVISIGSMLDVGWGDLIDYLGDDPHTRGILLYMESVGEARSFLSAAREVAWQKPIIVIKAGRTAAAAQAAASHTGALAGSDAALDAAFRRAGVLRVGQVSTLFAMAEILAKQSLPQGPRLAIVSNAGGPGVLATDALIEAGGQLAALAEPTREALSVCLPPHWSRANPVDVLGDATPERYAASAKILLDAPECDGLLAILTPQAMTDPTQTAQRLAQQAGGSKKPVIAVWMGGQRVREGIEQLNRSGIPTLPYPDAAAEMFHYMWRRSEDLRALYETPALPDTSGIDDAHERTAAIVNEALAAGRTLLTEAESKQLLAVNGIRTVETRLAVTADEAVEQAAAIGFPVVLKLHSETITHKARVGGVKLNLPDAKSVRQAFDDIAAAVERAAGPGAFQGVSVQPMIARQGYELILGSSVDSQLGPLILFGAGGSLVEVFGDRALGLPPLTTTLARRVMERTKIYAALRQEQSGVDLAALEQLLVRFASLVIEYPRIREIDINPLLAGPAGLLALDARVVLHPAAVADADLPQPAIRPYPRQYVDEWTARDGRPLLIRPIRPEDEPLLAQFHEMLSERTVYARYSQVLSLGRRTVHERLARLCFIDYDRQMALVAINLSEPEPKLIAVARLIKMRGTAAAEFALVIADAYQHLGLGTELMRRLIEIGRDEQLEQIVGYIHATNQGMLKVCRRLGFEFSGDGSQRVAVIRLGRDGLAAPSP